MGNTTSTAMADLDTYREILAPVLSKRGMQRYLNGDAIELDPSDFRAIIDNAFARRAAQPVAPALPADAHEVIEAARKLVKAKGRYHTEQNYKALAAALDNLATPSPQVAEGEELPPPKGTLDKGDGKPFSYWTEEQVRDAIAASRRAATEKEARALDALDSMGFTYDREIGWLPPAAQPAEGAGQAAPANRNIRPEGCCSISADAALKSVTLRFETADQFGAYYSSVSSLRGDPTERIEKEHPVYFVAHPDGSFSPADPQPKGRPNE